MCSLVYFRPEKVIPRQTSRIEEVKKMLLKNMKVIRPQEDKSFGTWETNSSTKILNYDSASGTYDSAAQTSVCIQIHENSKDLLTTLSLL